MSSALAAQDAAERLSMKQQAAGRGAAGKAGPDADATAAAGARQQLIAAVPGPLGREEQQRCSSSLGHGLAETDRRQLHAESARQEAHLDQVGAAVETLKEAAQAMGQELQEQAPRLAALQQRTDDAQKGLHTVARSAAKLAGA